MKRAILFTIVLCLASACATVPVPPARNAELTESNLPSKTNIEGIRPRKCTITAAQKLIVPTFVWDGTLDCYNMVFEFYGKPTYEASSKDIARRFFLTGWKDPESFADRENEFNVYGFKDENPSKPKIKYFLSQGHPVIAYLGYERGGSDGKANEYYLRRQVVLTGYDDTEGIFICWSPSLGKVERLPYKAFNELHSAWASGLLRRNYGQVLYPKGLDARQIPAPKQMEPISLRQTKTQPIPPKGVDTIGKPKTSTLVTPSSGTTNIVTVTWTFVNIRSGPGNNYPIVASVKQGDKLTVIGKSGEWFNVRLENGQQQGWVANRVVK